MNNLSPRQSPSGGVDISDQAARQVEAHRAALIGHCYRMLGSAAEAEDAVQETMLRAFRSMAQFEGRSSLKTWLYRIATRVCLDVLSSEERQRTRPVLLGPMGSIDEPLQVLPGSRWVEPICDASALPADADPAERAVLRQSIRLAFVAALQHLPPRPRAALLLTEVLGWSAAETAESLGMSVAAVNSALQRARATLAERELETLKQPLADPQAALLERYVAAFESYDMDALARLLHEDATLSMPPYSLWLRGHATLRRWLLGPGIGCRGSRLIPTWASGAPAFAQYRPGGPDGSYPAWALIVLEYEGERIAAMNSFLDTAAVFPRFGLPLSLPR